MAVGPLDRESREEYELLVKASDRGSPQREVSVNTQGHKVTGNSG